MEVARANLEQQPPRSSILVGPPGAGKTSVALRLFESIHRDGWVMFEATASGILAGQSFIGQLEERIQALVETMSVEKKTVWYCPGVHELVHAGQHVQNPIGLFELVLPFLESGVIRLVGETTPSAYERMLQYIPKARFLLDPIRVEPLESQVALSIALTRFAELDRPPASEEVIREASTLADQYLISSENPGRLVDLLDATRRRMIAANSDVSEMKLDDVLETVSMLSGLPLQLLDDRAHLDLVKVRAHFEDRILGQPEAVSAIVDRIALAKAGLTDPTRPLGVFLFVGPSGTGKTEIAHALAEYLFGSIDRMVRLDMSEFQDEGSLDRLLGERGFVADPRALVTQIRQNPFSVVLLDEIEKAAPEIWDLFLQVFDEGRLTARNGTTADFRSCMLILTSNLGAADSQTSGLGFSPEQASFSHALIERSLETTFRPEFLNRLDRVVVFRPLSRPVMRRLLNLELKKVYQRRGLRRRGWAIEWDEAAIEFLIDRGFSPTLGARPLKRAVERFFLSRLAEAIVEHRAPSGEQFLFVRLRNGRLDVEFVDPDAPDPNESVRDVAETPADVQLETIALSGLGSPGALSLLTSELDWLVAHTTDDDWASEKSRCLATMSESDFWSREDRFAVLSRAEYMDRIEAGIRTAGSLLHRLNQSTNPPRQLVRQLAQQLYLVREAVLEADEGYLGEAYLEIRPSRDPADAEASVNAALRLQDMYRHWADRRRMRCRVMEREEDDGLSTVLAVSGFGAFRILAPETGYHVFEFPGTKERVTYKGRVRVRVTVDQDVPDPNASEVITGHAGEAAHAPVVVRRYRLTSSPSVRDAIRGWKTGKLDVVLQGDFDLLK